MRPCSLLSLATAVPPRSVEQQEAKARAREAWGGSKPLFDRLASVFDNAGIERRHIVAPQDWYMADHGWHDRNNVYLKRPENLFVDAASAAIEKAGLNPDDIDGVVTVSTTASNAQPGSSGRIPCRFQERHSPSARLGLGCAGEVNGLAATAPVRGSGSGDELAVRFYRDLLDLDPARQRRPRGDRRHRPVRRRGGGSVVTSGEHSLARITGSAEKIWPDTLRIMGWDVEDPALQSCSTGPSHRSSRPAGPGCGRDVRRTRDQARRNRPLLLPSGRGRGYRRD